MKPASPYIFQLLRYNVNTTKIGHINRNLVFCRYTRTYYENDGTYLLVIDYVM